jgi:transcriptional regulator with XRE-family HTH domain
VKVTASEKFHPQAMAAVLTRPFNGRMKKRQFRRTFIRQWRESRNLTLEKLAGRLNMTASHLSMLERGQRGYTQETLEAIAEALQTDVASLLMRDPSNAEAMWSIWDKALPGQRRVIEDLAKTIIQSKTGS